MTTLHEREQAMRDCIAALPEYVQDAVLILLNDGTEDGAHHKMWAIDQALRVLAGPEYARLIVVFKSGEDGAETYGYDEGVAP